ncbi:hypothetical protein NQT62_11665 [Limnobacter humi]|uniref:Cytochrome b/b6 C-terminal region profile domain-containing protein n=1 Tax=Limnobacter humi TaxID=1778671 RepID=A0ABT1WHU5_9BURK|nr:hypothetical protein [Limnobacter humi]MCQ8897091.1 hypothetical protein [Limnobacter humi]
MFNDLGYQMQDLPKDHYLVPPRWLRYTLIHVPLLMIACVALFWPAHSSPFGLDFTTSWLVENIPQVQNHVKRSSFPHATAAYAVLSTYLLFPSFIGNFITPFFWVSFGFDSRLNKKPIPKFKFILVGWGLIFFAMTLIILLYDSPAYNALNIFPVSDNRVALATLGLAHLWPTLTGIMLFSSYLFFSLMHTKFQKKVERTLEINNMKNPPNFYSLFF